MLDTPILTHCDKLSDVIRKNLAANSANSTMKICTVNNKSNT